MRYSFVIAICLSSFFSQAQLLDTSDVHLYKPVEVSTTTERDYLLMRSDSVSLDTSFRNFQTNYKPYQNNFPFVDLGLEGSPILALGNGNERATGFGLGAKNLSYYFFSDTVHVYQTPRPFTRFNYSQGRNELINISATHAQQLSKRLSFGVDYHRLKNQNFYYSNITNGARVRMNNWFNTKVYTNYCSKDRRYEILASYLWNKGITLETGGLSSDSFFNSLSSRNKIENNKAKYIEAFGEQAQNKFSIVQYFRPQKSIEDSTQIYKLDRFTNQFYLKSSADFSRISFYDNAPDSTIYGSPIDEFKDSIGLRTYSNELGYSIKLNPLTLAIGVLHSYNSIVMNSVNDVYNNVYITSLGMLDIRSFKINASAQLGALGYNLGDYKITAIANTTWKSFNVSAGILSQLAEPFYTEQKLQSTLVSWDNDFSKTSINQLYASAKAKFNKHHLAAQVFSETSSNLIYFDTDLFAKQHSGFVSLLKIDAKYSYQAKHFGVEANGIFQEVSNPTILPRPKLAGNIDVYSIFKLFSNKLDIQMGVKTFWFSAFNSPTYNPQTRQWHLSQNSFSMYPPINAYLNAQLKSFCFGLEFFHAQMQLMGTEYYASPGYPVMPRVMRLNFRWDLSN